MVVVGERDRERERRSIDRCSECKREKDRMRSGESSTSRIWQDCTRTWQTGYKKKAAAQSDTHSHTGVHLQRLVRVPVVGRTRQRRAVQIGLVVLCLGLLGSFLGRGRRREGRRGRRCGRADGRRGGRKDGADRGLLRGRVLGVGKRLKAAETDVRAVDLLHGRIASDAAVNQPNEQDTTQKPDTMQKKVKGQSRANKSRLLLASYRGVRMDMAAFNSFIFRASLANQNTEALNDKLASNCSFSICAPIEDLAQNAVRTQNDKVRPQIRVAGGCQRRGDEAGHIGERAHVGERQRRSIPGIDERR